MNANAYRILSLPERLDAKLFVEAMLGNGFAIYHDFENGSTYLLTEQGTSPEFLCNAIAGMKLEDSQLDLEAKRFECLSVFPNSFPAIADMYEVLNGAKAGMIVIFTPSSESRVRKVKRKVEYEISKKEIRQTRSQNYRIESTSRQSELYFDSDIRALLISMLNSLNSAMLANGIAYEVNVAVLGPDSDKVAEYTRAKFFVLEKWNAQAGSYGELLEKAKRHGSVPVDISLASKLVFFANSISRVHLVPQQSGSGMAEKGILLGRVLDKGVKEGAELRVREDTLNLGAIITGLPGTGKTYAAMNIAEQALESGTPVVIISPTQEWNAFARKHGLNVMSLYLSPTKINFFKCDTGINIELFYENLATLLAIASNAGPYTRSLEKVLLAAFKKVYTETRSPDPTLVYDEIEKEIIEAHAKKNNAGVEYTKHGENIRAALQNLRLLLMRPEFAYAEGVDMSELLSEGAVFDLSAVSNNMKQFYYALLLNQVYSLTDSLDVYGSDKLRFLVCLEEAQLVLQNDEYTAAALDLRQRIQDFRKKGVGLMLVTHNITDINQSIRRLCQTKLYFRQSADVAKIAANDLMFMGEQEEAVADLLKSLGHRVCAVNCLSLQNEAKEPMRSLLVKSAEFSFGEASKTAGQCEYESNDAKASATTSTVISLIGSDGPVRARIEVYYVGEKVFEGETNDQGKACIENTLEGKPYKLAVLGDKKKDTRNFEIIGGEQAELAL